MTDIQITGEPTAVSIADDGVTVQVVSQGAVVAITEQGLQGPAGPTHETYQFSMRDQLEVAVGTSFIPFDASAQLLSLQAVVAVPPVGQDVVIDINVNGVSIWANPADRLTITAGQDESPVVTVFDTDSFVSSDRLSVDVDQVGTTNPGEDLIVMVRVLRN